MAASQRTTIYLPPKLYRALKVRDAVTNCGLSELVSEAVQMLLEEDAIDEDALRRRRKEPSHAYSEALRGLKRDGLL
jgi:Ribbon-helix-helix domain